MISIPDNPNIYHITHINNLCGIINSGVIWSDAKRIELGLGCEIVGMSSIKRRRLEELIVKCHPSTKVGEYVPFYFCPRSIMLFIIHRGNHPDITYWDGQEKIIHLMSDANTVTSWAEKNKKLWAFSNINAGARYANFYKDQKDFDKVNWDAVNAIDFRDMLVQDGKQAEFLLYESFPWQLINKIGVYDSLIEEQVLKAISNASHKPIVSIEKSWYY